MATNRELNVKARRIRTKTEGVRTQALERSSQKTLEVVEKYDKRKKYLQGIEAGEVEQQFQISIQGNVAGLIAWTDPIELRFDSTFYNATSRRDSPYEKPQLSVGAVILSGPVVLLTAVVVKWETGDVDEVSGCLVKLGAVAPGEVELIEFKGEVHLTFQGYGAPDLQENGELSADP